MKTAILTPDPLPGIPSQLYANCHLITVWLTVRKEHCMGRGLTQQTVNLHRFLSHKVHTSQAMILRDRIESSALRVVSFVSVNEENKKKNRPLVSIGVPTFNRADALGVMLDSLLAQTYKNIEIVISDNASTDNTETLCRTYAARDARIFYIRQERNIGQMNNYSFLLGKARGAYFMWAQDDDYLDTNYVAVLTDVLEKNLDYSVALSFYYEKRIGALIPLPVRALTHDYTKKSYRELYERCLYGKMSALLLYGLYRTDILKKLYARQLPLVFNNLLLWMAEAVLAVKVYSVPLLLYTHTQDVRSHEARQPDGPLTRAEKKPFAITRYVVTGPLWLLASRAIPLHRKFLIFGPWLRRAWLYKRKMFNEFWRAFRALWRRA